MRKEIMFTWTEKQRMSTSRDPLLAKPAWAQVAGYGCAALSSTAPPATSQQWVSLSEVPQAGQVMPLRVSRPFRGALRDLIWVAFSPPAQSPDLEATWCSVPAALPTGGVALCLILEVLGHDEPEAYWMPGAWLLVSIEDVIALPEMATRFSPRMTGLPLPPGIEPESKRLWGCRQDDFNFVEFSAEGDVQEWVVWQRRGEEAAVILGGDRLIDDDIIYAGHRKLTTEELRFLEACQRQARDE